MRPIRDADGSGLHGMAATLLPRPAEDRSTRYRALRDPSVLGRLADGRWNGGASRCELPDPQLRTGRGEASRDASPRLVRAEDEPDAKPWGLDRVCTRLESRGTKSARRALRATSVHVQADS